MFVFTLIVIGCLCLAFKPTRLTGVAGLTLLSLVHPKLFLALLVIGSIALIILYYKRRNHHVLPQLPTRSD